MAHYSFNQDLEAGLRTEQEVLTTLPLAFPGMQIIKQTSSVKEYDILISCSGKQISFEIKDDILSAATGNIAIEFECRGKPSGIAVTKADYWIQKINNRFYIIKTKELRSAIRSHLFTSSTSGGDPGSKTKLFLFKQSAFLHLWIKL